MATIKDVARHAGVTISTVSAALNRSAPVSKHVLERVRLAVSAVGYVPHGGARSLRSGRSRMIGLLVPNIANPLFAAVAREVENICLNAGYLSVVFSTGQDPHRESQVLEVLRVQRIAGLIIIPTRSDADHGAQLIRQIGIPTVLLDMQVEGLPYPVVKSDNVEAGRLATEHLLTLGHRRIGIVFGIDGLATSDDRLAGYLKAHAARAVFVAPELQREGLFDQAHSQAETAVLLAMAERPTALIAISNLAMVGMLIAIRKAGLKIPSDISVVGIDDLETAPLLDPPPTVIEMPILAATRRAAEIVFAEIGGDQVNDSWDVLQPRLIVRGSTAIHQSD